MPEPAPSFRTLDAQWRRCERDLRSLTLLEAVQAVLGVFLLVVVALCGVVAITPSAVASGAVGLPLGLGLAVTLGLTLLGLAFRIRISHAIVSEELFRLDCARRSAAERERPPQVGGGPYRAPASGGAPAPCTRCLFHSGA